jgi:aspartyl protease family protein
MFPPMRSVIMLAAVALVAAVTVPRYLANTNGFRAQPTVMTAQPAVRATPAPAPVDTRSVVVPRDGHGHFHVEARVDGRRLSFLVDTGASMIALTADDAAALGIHPSERDFTVQVKTANGIVRAAPVQIDRVEIEDLTVRDVAALVLPEGALSDNLLGMSFLSRLHRWEFADGKLVLEQ